MEHFAGGNYQRIPIKDGRSILLLLLWYHLVVVFSLIADVFASVFRVCIHARALHKKGPIYVIVFRPLGIVIAVVIRVSFLEDTLYTGR
ncbi:hypothetical protein GIB67_021564 [Kingdonia uniflora]|uniref:Uncharacterized protein n=1 Tax=Kingdonia uniflora TaxID=39325 RepID=A0A7J7L9Z7_9MAGN|nr:hypothetical protein GIB67_021564 [Kingdonia uniflora]